MKRWTWIAPVLSLALFGSSTAFAANAAAPAAHEPEAHAAAIAAPAAPTPATHAAPAAAAPSAAVKEHIAALAAVVHPLIGGRPDGAGLNEKGSVVFQRELPDGHSRLAAVTMDAQGRPATVSVAHHAPAGEGKSGGLFTIAKMPWAAAVRAKEEGLGQVNGATPLPPPVGFVHPDPSEHQTLLFAADEKGTRNSGTIRVENGKITAVESMAAPFHAMTTARSFGLGALTEERAVGEKATDFVFQNGTVHMTASADGSRTVAGIALRPRDASHHGEVEVPSNVFEKARAEKLGPLMSSWTGAAPREGSHEPIGFGTAKEPRTFVFANGTMIVDPAGRIMSFRHVSN